MSLHNSSPNGNKIQIMMTMNDILYEWKNKNKFKNILQKNIIVDGKNSSDNDKSNDSRGNNRGNKVDNENSNKGNENINELL